MRKLALILAAAIYMLAGDVSFDQLIAKAKQENKVALVFIESDNCPWCKRMKEKTFTNKMVAKKIQEELVFGIFDNNDKSLPANIKARNTPTAQFVSGDGELLLSVIGFEPAGNFMKRIEAAQAKIVD